MLNLTIYISSPKFLLTLYFITVSEKLSPMQDLLQPPKELMTDWNTPTNRQTNYFCMPAWFSVHARSPVHECCYLIRYRIGLGMNTLRFTGAVLCGFFHLYSGPTYHHPSNAKGDYSGSKRTAKHHICLSSRWLPHTTNLMGTQRAEHQSEHR